jgi:hypothetical protein
MKKLELPLFAILIHELKMSQRQRFAATRLLRKSEEEIAAEAKAARAALREPKEQVYMVSSRDPISPTSFGSDCIWGTDVEDAMKRTEQHRRQEGEYAIDARDLVNLADEIGELVSHARNVRPGEEDDEY